MNLLLITWWTCVTLAIISLGAMTGLIIHRARRIRRTRADNARRKELQKFVFELVDEPGRLPEVKGQLRPEDRDLLLKLFGELLEKVRGRYADRVVALMRSLGLREECLKRLNDKSWWVRAEAGAALGVFNDSIVKVALGHAVVDPVMEVRVEAARSLVKLAAVRSVSELIQYLVPEDRFPSMPVMALFRSLGRAAVPQLIAVLENETSAGAKLLVVDALGHISDARAVRTLLNLYNDSSPVVRVGVMKSLAMLRDPQALPAVLLTMTDDDWEVRAHAASCAGRIGRGESIPLLEKLLTDDHWWVRYHAAEALYTIGGGGILALRTAENGGDTRAEEMARGLLLEKGFST